MDVFSPGAEHFQPKQIVKSLIPSWNTLVFFEVSPVSFHQVSEVLSEEKSRLSISGWFHGPSLTRPPTYFEPLIARSPHIPQDVRINSCCWDSLLRSCGISFAFLFFIYLAALGLHCSVWDLVP